MPIPYSLALRHIQPGKPEMGNKTFPVAQYAQNLDMKAMAQHMASHGSKYHKGDIIAVATQLVDCVHKGSTPGLIFLPCSTFTQSTRFWGKMQEFSYDLADERGNNTIFAAEKRECA